MRPVNDTEIFESSKNRKFTIIDKAAQIIGE
jgi:hypothetical protein